MVSILSLIYSGKFICGTLSSPCLNQIFHADPAQLAADTGDVHTQCIVINEYLIIPQIVYNVFPGYDFTAPGKEIPADAQLVSGKLHCLIPAGQSAVQKIEPASAAGQDTGIRGCVFPSRAFQHRGYSGKQNGGHVGLCDVVIATHHDAVQFIHGGAPAGHKDDRRVFCFADLPAQRQAVNSRKLDVQQDQIRESAST